MSQRAELEFRLALDPRTTSNHHRILTPHDRLDTLRNLVRRCGRQTSRKIWLRPHVYCHSVELYGPEPVGANTISAVGVDSAMAKRSWLEANDSSQVSMAYPPNTATTSGPKPARSPSWDTRC